ncbi:MAG: NAD(P)-dependent oxidoreductase [Pseudomonadota bacterium]
MNIGIAGTGRMGNAIASRLIGLGHTLTVWNRTPEKTKAAVAAGAAAAATPTALASKADVVITILTNAAAIDAVYYSADGLLAGDVRGKLFIEMSTVRPETERALAEWVAKKHAQLVECPVGGTVGPAKEGKLFGLVGADSQALDRARPLLEQMCRRIEHVGPAGAGAAMKLAINLPLIVFWQAFGEAVALTKPLGIDPARLVEIFSDTSGAATVLKNRGAAVAKALAGEDTGPAAFDLDAMRKDLRTMLEEATGLGVELPTAARVLEAFDRAAHAGHGGIDGVRIPAWVSGAAKS